MDAMIVQPGEKGKLFVIYQILVWFLWERTGILCIVVRSVDADLLCSPHGQGWSPRGSNAAQESARHARV